MPYMQLTKGERIRVLEARRKKAFSNKRPIMKAASFKMELTNQIEVPKASQKKTKESVIRLKKQLSLLNNEIRQQNLTVTALKNRLSDMKEEVEMHEDEYKYQFAEIEMLNNERTELNNKIESHRKERTILNDKILQSEKDIRLLRHMRKMTKYHRVDIDAKHTKVKAAFLILLLRVLELETLFEAKSKEVEELNTQVFILATLCAA